MLKIILTWPTNWVLNVLGRDMYSELCLQYCPFLGYPSFRQNFWGMLTNTHSYTPAGLSDQLQAVQLRGDCALSIIHPSDAP